MTPAEILQTVEDKTAICEMAIDDPKQLAKFYGDQMEYATKVEIGLLTMDEAIRLIRDRY